jgi:hypothetical protein
MQYELPTVIKGLSELAIKRSTISMDPKYMVKFASSVMTM